MSYLKHPWYLSLFVTYKINQRREEKRISWNEIITTNLKKMIKDKRINILNDAPSYYVNYFNAYREIIYTIINSILTYSDIKIYICVTDTK